jgi:hypothetical protein
LQLFVEAVNYSALGVEAVPNDVKELAIAVLIPPEHGK